MLGSITKVMIVTMAQLCFGFGSNHGGIQHGVDGCIYQDMAEDKVNEQFADLIGEGIEITKGCAQLSGMDGFCAEEKGRQMCCVSCGERANPSETSGTRFAFTATQVLNTLPPMQQKIVMGTLIAIPVVVIAAPVILGGYVLYKTFGR